MVVESDSAVPNTSERIVSNLSVMPKGHETGHFTTGGTEEKKNEVSSKDKKKITQELNTSKCKINHNMK